MLNHLTPYIIRTYHIIAVTPHIAYILDKSGISYSTPEDYIDLTAMNRIGSISNKKFDVFLNSVFSHITHPFLSTNPLKNFYFFQRLYTTITIGIKTIEAILEREKPDEVFYISNDDIDERSEEFIYRKKSIYSAILPLFSAHTTLHAIDTEPLPTPKNSEIVYNRITHDVFTQIVPWRKKENAQRTILFLDTKYNLKHLIDMCLKKDECNVLVWDLYRDNTWEVFFSNSDILNSHADIVNFRTTMIRLWSELASKTEFRSLFTIDTHDAWDVLKPHFEYFVTDSLQKSYANYHAIDRFHRTQPIDIILSSLTIPFAHTIETIFNWAHNNTVPTVTYQHGGGFGYVYRQAHNRTDFHQPDYFFGFGNGVKQYVEKHQLHTQVYPVGASMIEGKSEEKKSREQICRNLNLDPDKKIAGYIATGYYNVIHHNPGDLYPDHMYFSIQKQLFEFFRQHPDVQFLVKPYMREFGQITREYLITENIPNVIPVSMPIATLHSVADMYVLDFISTILLETIASGKPLVMYYNQHTCPLEPEALELLKKRVHYSEDFNSFCADFDRVISAIDTDQKCKNDEFFLSYIAPSKDGNSTARAYKALLTICEQHTILQNKTINSVL